MKQVKKINEDYRIVSFEVEDDEVEVEDGVVYRQTAVILDKNDELMENFSGVGCFATSDDAINEALLYYGNTCVLNKEVDFYDNQGNINIGVVVEVGTDNNVRGENDLFYSIEASEKRFDNIPNGDIVKITNQPKKNEESPLNKIIEQYDEAQKNQVIIKVANDKQYEDSISMEILSGLNTTEKQFNPIEVKNFFDTELPKILNKSDDEIEKFMANFGTKDEWLEKKNVNDYKKESLSNEELEDLQKRAYDVDYMSEILVENITLYIDDINILNNMKNALDEKETQKSKPNKQR